MLNLDFNIDIHVHSTYKPLGAAVANGKYIQKNKDDKSSLWFYNPPSPVDKIFNYLLNLTKFSQANLTSSYYGNVWVMVLAMGSIEKKFFNNFFGLGEASALLDNFVVGLGTDYIRHIENTNDYFNDLQNELFFVQSNMSKSIKLDQQTLQYKLVNNFNELEEIILSNENTLKLASENGGRTNLPITIALIMSVEGMHVLNCGLDDVCSPQEVILNARKLKKLSFSPWFVTFSHHFYNELCGHSRSLSGHISKICDQTKGINTSFTSLGEEVLEILLNDTDGKRIFIDIKHLSAQGRLDYFKKRNELDPDNTLIPVIISHGACNGFPDRETLRSEYEELAEGFCKDDINFYDMEILEVVKTNGIFGLQLDERRIANEEALRRTKNSIFRNKIMHYRSELVWKQIQYIAELLDKKNLPSWQHIAIGSDYDGIVDPVNSFWTTEQYNLLKSYLERHAFEYLKTCDKRLINKVNRAITADQIVQNIFQLNAWNFFKRWY